MKQTFDRDFCHAGCVAFFASYKWLSQNIFKMGLDRMCSYCFLLLFKLVSL